MPNLKRPFVYLILLFYINPTSLFGQTFYPYPDPTFGLNGHVQLTIPSATSTYLGSCVTLNDESIIIAGRGTFTKTLTVAHKITATGSIDYSFGSNGYIYHDSPDPDLPNFYNVVLKRSDKKFLLSFKETNSRICLSFLCFDENGEIDYNYGINGYSEIAGTPPAPYPFVYNIHTFTIDPHDRVIFSGVMYNIYTKSDYYLLIGRYTANGFIDSTFGTDGIDTLPVMDNSFGLKGVEVTQDMSLLAYGSVRHPSNNHELGIIVKWNKNGVLDTNFGVNGIQEIEPPRDSTILGINAVEVLPSESIVIAGVTKKMATNSKGVPYIAKLDPFARIDTSFGDNGFAEYPRYINNSIKNHGIGQVYPLSDSNILALNSMSTGVDFYLSLSMYTASGQIDSNWNNGELYFHKINQDTVRITGLDFSQHGKLVLISQQNLLSGNLYASRLFLGHSALGGITNAEDFEVPFVYPNPVGYNLNLDLNDVIKPGNTFEYQIISVNGQRVFKGKLTEGKQLSIDVSFLASGVYILNILTDKSNEQLKFVKL